MLGVLEKLIQRENVLHYFCVLFFYKKLKDQNFLRFSSGVTSDCTSALHFMCIQFLILQYSVKKNQHCFSFTLLSFSLLQRDEISSLQEIEQMTLFRLTRLPQKCCGQTTQHFCCFRATSLGFLEFFCAIGNLLYFSKISVLVSLIFSL